ncbi:MAG: ATP-binding protein [Clostridia bacterium]
MPQFEENRPTAEVLMFSMRAMGYSFEAAIADIIDNSISAGASQIQIGFPYSPSECYVSIIDNGYGMTPDELFNAMKYGSLGKSSVRSESDLGRFGLGLKSASLSQCRKLTVISKKKDVVSAMSWDLDLVEERRDWILIIHTAEESSHLLCYNQLDDLASGTVVIWENFDILKKDIGSNGIYSELQKLAEVAEHYLSLIFHRFINKRAGEKTARLCIRINEHLLSGYDPFLEHHKRTNQRRMIDIAVQEQPYVLPFQKDISKEDMKRLGGIDSYRTKQGFYIYRNERLIIWGTWFGRPKVELTKHARIKVDIPNTLDDLWNIDIKKQSARIPSVIRQKLTKAVDEAMDIAIRAQKYRGRVEQIDSSIDYVWERISQRDGLFTYHINRNARIFDLLQEELSSGAWQKLMMVLDEIDCSLPCQQIYLDKASNCLSDKVNESRREDVLTSAQLILPMMIANNGGDKSAAIDTLFASEPWCYFPNLRAQLIEE